jgi:hypothetical protein
VLVTTLGATQTATMFLQIALLHHAHAVVRPSHRPSHR